MSHQLNDNVPSWRRKVSDGNRSTWASLTPEELAEAAADRQARRAKAIAKNEAKRALRVAASEMLIAGAKPAEVSSKTGLSLRSLWYGRLYWGLPIAVRQGCRRLFAWLPDADVAALDALAADMGLDRGQALAALLRAVLMDGGLVARRTLGIKRKAVAA
jgi:hypothetical protein